MDEIKNTSSGYDLSKTMELRMQAFELLKTLFENKNQDCCNLPIGFVLFVFDCRSTMCSGNITKAISIEEIQSWLLSEKAGTDYDPQEILKQDAN